MKNMWIARRNKNTTILDWNSLIGDTIKERSEEIYMNIRKLTNEECVIMCGRDVYYFFDCYSYHSCSGFENRIRVASLVLQLNESLGDSSVCIEFNDGRKSKFLEITNFVI